MSKLKQHLEQLPPWTLYVAPGALVFLASLVALDRVPYFGGDEVYPASTALTFAREGRFARDVTRGSLGSEVFDAFPPASMLLLSAVYKVFDVGPWTTRIPSVLAGALAVSLFVALVHKVTESRVAALLGGLLLGTDPILVQRSRVRCQEPLALAFLTAALYMVLKTNREAGWSERKRAVYWVAGGVLFAAAVASYQFAALAAVAFLGGLLFTRQWRPLVWTGGGGLLGAALWAFWLWGRMDYFNQQVVEVGASYAKPLTSALAHEWERYQALIDFRTPVVVLVILLTPVAALSIWRTSRDPDVRALCAAGLLALLMLCTVGMKSPIYFLFLSPFVYFCLASCMVGAEPQALAWRLLGAVSVLGGGAVLVGIWYKAAREWTCRDPIRFEQQVARYIRPGDFVVGPGALWLPTIRRGGDLRITCQGFGEQTEPFQRDFLMDPRALSRASKIVLDAQGPELLERYPILRDEVQRREKLFEAAPACGTSTFTVSIFGERRMAKSSSASEHGPAPASAP